MFGTMGAALEGRAGAAREQMPESEGLSLYARESASIVVAVSGRSLASGMKTGSGLKT